MKTCGIDAQKWTLRAYNTMFLRAYDTKFVDVHMLRSFHIHMIRIYPTTLILPIA